MPKTYSINPDAVKYGMVDFEFDIRKHDEKTIDGIWDQKLAVFEGGQSGTLLRSLIARSAGTKWEDTEYWEFLAKSVERKVVHCGCKDMKDVWLRCYDFVDGLVQATNKENRIPDNYNQQDNIGVNVTRDGKIVLNNGRHRMCVAKFLGIPSVPVCINVRHKQWAGFKSQIRAYAKGAEGHVYAPLRHFDLQEFSSIHTGRAELIHSHIHPHCQTVLDIGAHWGSHSIYLASKGLTCTAAENDAKALGFLRKFIQVSRRPVKVFDKSVFTLPKPKFDVVLALRIFHHFLKEKKHFTSLISLLQRLDAQELYFQPHDKKVQRMSGAYRNFNESDFIWFIMENTSFTEADQIGETVGGPIYRFHR